MAERDPEEQEQLNRQLLELLNELRVALPGVQVLFAFLLAGYHRLLFQRGDRPRIIRHGTRLFIAGLVCLAIAMTGAVYLVTEVVFSTATAIPIGAVAAMSFGWLWFGAALWRRWRAER